MKQFKLGDTVTVSKIFDIPRLSNTGVIVAIPANGTIVYDNDIFAETDLLEDVWDSEDCEGCSPDPIVKHAVLFEGERKYFVKMIHQNKTHINFSYELYIDKSTTPQKYIEVAVAAGPSNSKAKKGKTSKKKSSKKAKTSKKKSSKKGKTSKKSSKKKSSKKGKTSKKKSSKK